MSEQALKVYTQARAAQAVKNEARHIRTKINEARGSPQDAAVRWPFELLQNALDAGPRTGRPSVNISLTHDKGTFVFEHDGAFFQIQELAALLSGGSSKDFESAETTGRFGTGFLVTHVLAPSVRLQGLLVANGRVEQFDLRLDRRGDEDSIVRNIESCNAAIGEAQPIRATDGVASARFIYGDDDEASFRGGIEAFRRALPYLFATCPQLRRVRLPLEGKVSETWEAGEVIANPASTGVEERTVTVAERGLHLRVVRAQLPEGHASIVLTLSMTRIVQHVAEALRFQNAERLEPVFDPERPIRSTGDMRPWYTGRPCERTKRSHINFCVYDSRWEAQAAFELDRSPHVTAWAKNDHLGFEILYLWKGVVAKYRPDYLVRLAGGTNLVLEVKGRDAEREQAKRRFLDEWVAAVNAHGGFGKWAWDVALEPADAPEVIERRAAGRPVAEENRPDGASAILRACQEIGAGDLDGARCLVREEHPFAARRSTGRGYTKIQMVRVFARDGFIDRYSGERLVFPGVLRLLAHLMPDELPWHPHGKMDRCHILHWTLWPSIDHFVPLARGGADAEGNWVTTSTLRNMSKGQATLEELGWRVYPAGRIEDWDGLTGWFLKHVERHPVLLDELRPLRDWSRAAATVLVDRREPRSHD